MGNIEFFILFVLIDVYSYISFSVFSFFTKREQDIVNQTILPLMLATYFIFLVVFSINKMSKALSYPIVRIGLVFLLLLSRLFLYILVIGALIF
jgi:hypothetical protein